MLDKARRDADHKVHSAKRKFEDAIYRLDHYPPVDTPSLPLTSEDTSDVRAYLKEVGSWIEETRPLIKRMRQSPQVEPSSADSRESSTTLPTPSDERLPPRPSTSHTSSELPASTLAQHCRQLSAAAAKVEERLQGLEEYFLDLRGTKMSFVHQRLEELELPGEEEGADNKRPLTQAEVKQLRKHLREKRHDVEKMRAELAGMGERVKELKERYPARDIQLQALREGNAELVAKQTEVRSSHPV